MERYTYTHTHTHIRCFISLFAHKIICMPLLSQLCSLRWGTHTHRHSEANLQKHMMMGYDKIKRGLLRKMHHIL